MSEHPNSRKITIFRATSFLSKAHNKDASGQSFELFTESKQSIGSYFESRGSTRIGSGLTIFEEELLMPYLIDSEKDDRDFRAKVKEFFIDIDTKVPHGINGLTLEIGLESNNESPISKNNRPLNILEFIRYRHASKHPDVALSKDLTDGNQQKLFYISDPLQLKKKSLDLHAEKDAAQMVFLQIKTDSDKVKAMLSVLGVDVRAFNSDSDRLTKLREIADSKPKDFAEAFNQSDLDIRSWIKNMVTFGVLQNIGPRYRDTETNSIIADSIEELIFLFKDESQTDTVMMLKARMQEAASKPVLPTSRKTQRLSS